MAFYLCAAIGDPFQHFTKYHSRYDIHPHLRNTLCGKRIEAYLSDGDPDAGEDDERSAFCPDCGKIKAFIVRRGLEGKLE
jgi:hypothetical protein